VREHGSGEEVLRRMVHWDHWESRDESFRLTGRMNPLSALGFSYVILCQGPSKSELIYQTT